MSFIKDVDFFFYPLIKYLGLNKGLYLAKLLKSKHEIVTKKVKPTEVMDHLEYPCIAHLYLER